MVLDDSHFLNLKILHCEMGITKPLRESCSEDSLNNECKTPGLEPTLY